jgi:hypothetical protein
LCKIPNCPDIEKGHYLMRWASISTYPA